MKTPIISVVLPAYNSAAFVKLTVESVLNQTFKDFELIVVDDGSTDTTANVLKNYRDQLRYVWKKNGGQSSSRNFGINLAQGKYIAFIDHDDLWLENKLELQLTEMSLGENVGMVTCGSILFTDNTELGIDTPKVNSLSQKELLNQLLIGNFLGSCSNALVKAECFHEVGLFDESLRMAEDWDMWLRIAQKYAVRAVEFPLIKYRLHPRNFSSLSGETNLTNELAFLKRTFADPSFARKHIIKRLAFSARYLAAALTSRENQQHTDIPSYLLRAFLQYPPVVLRKAFIGLLLYCFKTVAKTKHTPILPP